MKRKKDEEEQTYVDHVAVVGRLVVRQWQCVAL